MKQTAAVRSSKRNQVLATARGLFWKHGLRRISVEEICQVAGVSKMTFYRFFPNKIELAKAVFDQEVDLGVQRFRNILKDQSSPTEKIQKIVRLKLDSTNDISREFLNDFYGNDEPGLKQYIEHKSREAWNDMLKDFKEAQTRGFFREDLNPEFLLALSQRVSSMVTDDKLLRLYDSPCDLLVELTNFVAYGISPRSAGGRNNKTPRKKKK